LLNLVGNPVDFSDKSKEHWEVIEKLKTADFVHYSIPREDIEKCNIKPLLEFFNRILLNDELSMSFQGKIEVSVDGYFYDRRELWEIREVRRWAKKAEPKIKYWFFFCANPENNSTLTWLLTCLTNIISIEVNPTNKNKLRVEYETMPLASIIERNFHYLNELTDRYELSIEENKRISNDSVLALGLDIKCQRVVCK